VKTLFIQNNGIQESIGVANLSGILKANGHDTDLLLVSHTPDLIGAIKKYDPGLIAFSALTGVHHSIEKLAVTIKRQLNIPIIVGGYADAALRRAVRYGAGWYGFNRDIDATRAMLERLDAAFAKAGKTRGPDFQIIITPPVAMPIEGMAEYAELGVHRLVVNLGSQRPERVGPRLAEIETLVRTNT